MLGVDHDYAEPGPSNPKGKGIDLHEWGNLELNEEELDLMVQEAILNLYKSPKENTGYEKEQLPRRNSEIDPKIDLRNRLQKKRPVVK